MNSLVLYKFEILSDKNDVVPLIVLIGEETILAKGDWMSFIDRYIEGIITGLTLANYEITLNKASFINLDLKQNPDSIKLLNLWNFQNSL